jgi:hypothetical protein
MPDKSSLARCLSASGLPLLTDLMKNFMKKRVNGDRINTWKDL